MNNRQIYENICNCINYALNSFIANNYEKPVIYISKKLCDFLIKYQPYMQIEQNPNMNKYGVVVGKYEGYDVISTDEYGFKFSIGKREDLSYQYHSYLKNSISLE